jgi:SAM-dependent methyltransferase
MDSGGHIAGLAVPFPHITFDLNQAADPEQWPAAGLFDLVVIAEVIEHLVVAPELVLSCLASLCKPGGFIVCQTPNAAAFHKRLLLLAGRNPYERIRCYGGNPGHFRESSKRELVRFGSLTGLECVEHHYSEYFEINGSPARRWVGRFAMSILGVFPSFRRGQTMVYRRPR